MTGCGLIYSNVRAPYGYNTATPADVAASETDETVTGEACNQSALYLVAWGDAGYAAAAKKALAGHTNAILYDVRADLRVRAYLLGLYTRTCTVITARVGKAKGT